MSIAERLSWAGTVKVETFNLDGEPTGVEEFENLIVDDGLDLLVSALDGVDSEIKYMAWGTSSTAVSSSDSALGAESGRKAVTSAASGATGVYTTTVYLAPGDANVSIAELGWFAGATATGSADSGVLVARVLYSKAKTYFESVNVVRTDTLS